MDMYVRILDDLKRGREDNPTVRIILCAQKDAFVVRYSVLDENEQMFASRYKLGLPTEEELRVELEREREQLSSGDVEHAKNGLRLESICKGSGRRLLSLRQHRVALRYAI